MTKSHKTVSISSELQEWVTQERINTSELLEAAIIQEKKRREGRLQFNLDLDNVSHQIEVFETFFSVVSKQLEYSKRLYNELLNLENKKKTEEEMNQKKELHLKRLQLKAFNEFKKGFTKVLLKYEGRSLTFLRQFVRDNCPKEFQDYFHKVSNSICDKKEREKYFETWKKNKNIIEVKKIGKTKINKRTKG